MAWWEPSSPNWTTERTPSPLSLCSFCTLCQLKFSITLQVVRPSISKNREENESERWCLPSRSFKVNSDNTDRDTLTVRQRSRKNKHSRLSIHTNNGFSESWKLCVYPEQFLRKSITFLEGDGILRRVEMLQDTESIHPEPRRWVGLECIGRRHRDRERSFRLKGQWIFSSIPSFPFFKLYFWPTYYCEPRIVWEL